MKDPGVMFDVDALREKYALERDRRLRPDGIAQYVEIAGPFAGFAEDPWSDPHFTRDPLSDEVDVAIIGAGFGGLLTGVPGCGNSVCSNIRLIDKAADVGGTWYWNRYPGIACDVESYVYMPLLEELGYIPTEKYAKGDEIFAHCRRIAEHYDLYRDACLQTEVTRSAGTQQLSRWIIIDQPRRRDPGAVRRDGQRVPAEAETSRHRRNHGLSRPRIPHQPVGLRLHRHPTWPSCRTSGWGSSAPARPRSSAFRTWRRSVKHLLVFQRTPSTVDVRGNRPTDPDWSADLEDGWQRRRIENFQLLTAGGEADEDLVNDAWTSIVKKLFVMRQTQCRRDVGRRAFAHSRKWPTSPRWRRSGPASTRS